ncbi:MAG: insulinase family protein [Acidobacteriota bacterium]|nr:insulinase family protein [Acidobacteriota bacterium]
MKRLFSLLSISLFLLLPAQADKKLDRSKVPQPGPAPEIKLGDYATFQLDNGLKVFVVENNKLPRVSFSLILDLDPIHEGDAAGYLSAAGQLLRRGTTTRTKQEIDDAVDFIGASLFAGSASVSGSSLKKYSETVLELMADMTMNATMPEEEFQKIKKDLADGIRSSKDDPNTIAANLRSVLVYGKDHPYGQVTTEESVANITREHCLNYYKTYWRPNVAYLAVVGDTNPAEAKKWIKKYFGNWKRGDVPKHSYPVPKPPEKTKVAVVHKDGAVQTALSVTHPVVLKPGTPNALPASVTNTVLGGGSFRLFKNLREDKGYTYGAYSSLSADRLVSSFTASASVRNEVSKGAVKEFLYEMNRIRDEKVPQEELDLVKNYLTGNFALGLENPGRMATFAINIERYNMPRDYYDNYLKNIAKVDVDTVQAMAREYIMPANSWIIAVGDAELLAEELAEYGEVHRFDNYGNPYTAPKTKAVPAGVTARSVIDRHLEACGGKERIGAIQDLTMESVLKMGPQSIQMINRFRAPNQMSVQMLMNGQVMGGQIFDGVKGVNLQMGQKMPMDEATLENAKWSSVPVPEMNYDNPYFELKLNGVEQVDGKDVYHLEVHQKNGDIVHRWYDAESGLLVRTESTLKSPMGEVKQVAVVSDYREVEGIKVPFARTITRGPQSFEMLVEKITVNQKLDDSHFKID